MILALAAPYPHCYAWPIAIQALSPYEPRYVYASNVVLVIFFEELYIPSSEFRFVCVFCVIHIKQTENAILKETVSQPFIFGS